METIKKGSRGESVKKLQQLLGGLTVDGIFGANTETAVKQFQLKHGLTVDGIVGPKTWDKLLNGSSGNIILPNSLKIENYFLKPNEYYSTSKYKVDYIMIHHTAGGPNPYSVIDNWNTDTRGRVGVEFCIGGQNCSTGDATYDGKIIRAYPEGYMASHIGTSGSSYMNMHTSGIEICCMGHVDKNGKNYVGGKVLDSQRCTLKDPFRGYTQYHRYSDAQLKSLKQLLLYIANRDNIDLHEGMYKWIRQYGFSNKVFDYQADAYNGKIKGLISHGNVRKDKEDCHPQDELFQLISEL